MISVFIIHIFFPTMHKRRKKKTRKKKTERYPKKCIEKKTDQAGIRTLYHQVTNMLLDKSNGHCFVLARPAQRGEDERGRGVKKRQSVCFSFWLRVWIITVVRTAQRSCFQICDRINEVFLKTAVTRTLSTRSAGIPCPVRAMSMTYFNMKTGALYRWNTWNTPNLVVFSPLTGQVKLL